jgi:hypothetical protein
LEIATVGGLLGVSFLSIEMKIDIEIEIEIDTHTLAIYHTCCIHPCKKKKYEEKRKDKRSRMRSTS